VKLLKTPLPHLFTLLVLFSGIPKADSEIGGSIYLNQINNYQIGYFPNWVEANTPLKFTFGATNNIGAPVTILRSAFEVYSTDGASWQPIDAAWTTTVNWGSLFDGGVLAQEFDANGSGFDTANFVTFNLAGPGFANGSAAQAWTITTQVDSAQIGKHLCIDSVVNARGNQWLWTTVFGNSTPTWNGPHCFEIHADCCQGITGDINGDGTDGNALDLNYLVNRVFRAGPFPPCALEADMNGDGTSGNVADLNYLVNWLFRGGPDGISCP